MPTPRTGRLGVIVLGVIVATGAAARAQSALDGFDPGADATVRVMAVQPDGKIVVAGDFTALGGGTGTTALNRIGWLNADGSVDASFDPGAGANDGILALAVQPDGKILVGGNFTSLRGETRNRIGRLNPDGSLDTGFDPGANGTVRVVTVQADGKILVGGDFFTLGGGGTGVTTRTRIGRLHANGLLDTGFDPAAGGVIVFAIAEQPDGAILVGGSFATLGGAPRNGIGRLNPNGSIDDTFNPGANGAVQGLALQPDGKIVVSGNFTMLGGGGTGTTALNRIARLHQNGLLDATFDPGANGFIFKVAVEPNGKILVVGDFTMLGGGGTGTTTRNRIGRLDANGALDTTFNPGTNGQTLAVAVQPDGKILASGTFTTFGGGGTGTATRNRIGRLYPDGSLDTNFDPGGSTDFGSWIQALAVQPDGKILVNGGPGAPNTLRRLNPDGSLDPTFNAGADSQVNLWVIAVQPDGKILVGGSFTMLGGHTRHNIARLNPNGSIDESFDPGANANVSTLALQPDGKIVVGGFFTTLGGGGTGTTSRHYIGRLNASGSLDMDFDPGASNIVMSLAVQSDGKILAGGPFTRLGGGGMGTTQRNRIGRLHADGSLDTTFDPDANGTVFGLVLQADGKILVGGEFGTLRGAGPGVTTRNFLARLNSDGSVDTAFDPGANGVVFSMTVQADGRILVGGDFTTLGGGGTGTTTRNYLGRLNPDGFLDTSFDPGANSTVFNTAVQADGKIVAVGFFTTLGGGGTGTTARIRIGRLTNTGAALQELAVTNVGTVVTWSRSAVGPEVARVTFESSTDGATFSSLGNGTRVAGGWQLTGQNLPATQNLFIRARGYSATGVYNGFGSIVESIRNVYVASGFTDDPLTAGVSRIRSIHVTQLRTRIDAQRLRFGLLAFAWTDSNLGGVTVKAVHILELRSALQAAYAAAKQAQPSFTDLTLTAQQTLIRAVHISELRAAVLALE